MSPAPVSPASPPLKPTVSVTNDSATAPEVKAEVEGAYQTNETSQAPSNASNRIHPGPTDEAPAPPGGVAPPPIPRPAPMSEVAGSKEGQAAPQKKSEVQGPQEAGGADGHNGAGSNRPQSSGVLAPTETPSNILLKISPSSGGCLGGSQTCPPPLPRSLYPSLSASFPASLPPPHAHSHFFHQEHEDELNINHEMDCAQAPWQHRGIWGRSLGQRRRQGTSSSRRSRSLSPKSSW